MDREALKAMLREHEGLSLKAYKCPAGVWTIGYGHAGPDVKEGMTINLEEAELMLDRDCASVVAQCRAAFRWFPKISEKRQLVVANMVFNLGINRFRGFKRMIAAIEREHYELAANEMQASLWAGQVGRRAAELALMMREGDEVLH